MPAVTPRVDSDVIPSDTEVLIIGAGPAGLSAAITLSEAGIKVCIIDEDKYPGGQVYRSLQKSLEERPDLADTVGKDYQAGRKLLDRFAATDARYLNRTTLWDLAGPGPENASFGIGLLRDGKAGYVQVPKVIIATGAMERPVTFPGWTLPGVMTVGAAQTLMKASSLVPDGNVVIAGTGPLVYLYINQLLNAGIKPTALLDTGPGLTPGRLTKLPMALATCLRDIRKGLDWQRRIHKAGIKVHKGVSEISASGVNAVSEVHWHCHRTGAGTLKTDLLLVHDGVIPNTHLAVAAGCKMHWDGLQRCWRPTLSKTSESTVSGLYIAGDAAGIGGAELAVLQARKIAREIAAGSTHRRGQSAAPHGTPRPDDDERRIARLSGLRRFLDHYYTPSFDVKTLDRQTLICRCENITAAELETVAGHGCTGPNQAKAFCRVGMGPCMGRQCGNNVTELLAHYQRRPASDIGYFRIRPPLKPITVAELAEMPLPADPD